MCAGCGTGLSKTTNDMRQPATEFERYLQKLFRATKFGVLVECLLCGFSVPYVLTGGFGPCGPTRDVPGFVRFVHLPGSWLSRLFSGPMQFVVCIATTTAMLSGLAYILLRLLDKPDEKVSI